MVAKCGSTATPSRPRSLLEHTFAVMSSAGVASNTPPLITLSLPLWSVTSLRPSGVAASAVGDGIRATTVSVKPVGTTAGCGAAPEPVAPATHTSNPAIPIAIIRVRNDFMSVPPIRELRPMR